MAFKILLSRYSGQQDIFVGSPFAGRTRPDTRELIGYFTNILALRTDLSGNPEISSLIDRVRETVLEAYANQDYTFERLVADLNSSRKAREIPVFNVMFMFKNVSLSGNELPGANVDVVEFYCKRHKFDLTLLVSDATNELRCKLVFNDDIFNHSRVERMVEHFQTLLRGIAADIQGRLSGLRMLSEDERRTLLDGFNATPPPVPESSLPGCFEFPAPHGPGGVMPGRHGEAIRSFAQGGPVIGPGCDELGRLPAKHRVYVLDAWLEPTPIGVPGELYLGGAGMARACIDQPGLTSERFVADPYCIEPGSMMYRTGDRARWRPDGSLEFTRLNMPAPDRDQFALNQRYVAPRSPLELEVAAIWAEILRVPRVGIHDSFFELGGHSLAALRLFTRVRETLGVALSIRAIFDAPRLGQFARAVEGKRGSPGDTRARS